MAQKFDIKKTLVKGAWGIGYALVTGLLVIWQEDPKFVMVLPALMMLQNYLKHK